MPRLLLCLALVASLAVAACGQEAQEPGAFQSENAQVAETEGIYLDLDGLKYQVQVSRQMNPLLVSEREYFQGLTDDALILGDDEEWFGIFLQAENAVDEPVRTLSDIEVVDTQENVYRPVALGASNDYAYRPTLVQAGELYPETDSAAGERPPYGALVLFRVRRFSLDNRPLELVLTGNEGGKATVALDV